LVLGLSEGLGSTVDDRFHAVTVWVNNEAGVVVLAIGRPRSRAAVVLTSVQKRLPMELVY